VPLQLLSCGIDHDVKLWFPRTPAWWHETSAQVQDSIAAGSAAAAAAATAPGADTANMEEYHEAVVRRYRVGHGVAVRDIASVVHVNREPTLRITPSAWLFHMLLSRMRQHQRASSAEVTEASEALSFHAESSSSSAHLSASSSLSDDGSD